MAKSKDKMRPKPPATGSKTRSFKALGVVAAIFTWVFSIMDIALAVVVLLYSFCQLNKTSKLSAIFDYIYPNYLAGGKCQYSPDHLPVTPIWYKCKAGELTPILYSPRNETNPYATMIWIICHLVLELIWLLSTISLFVSAKKIKSGVKSSTYLVWVIVTVLVLAFDIGATVVYGLDITYAIDANNCAGASLFPDFSSNDFLFSTLAFPIFFSKGVVFLILFLVLVIMVPIFGKKAQREIMGHPVGQDRNPGISIEMLNKRVLEQVEDSSHNTFDADEMIKRVNHAAEKRSSEQWMFANDAFEPEYASPYANREPVFQPISEEKQVSPYMVSNLAHAARGPQHHDMGDLDHGNVILRPAPMRMASQERPLSFPENLDMALQRRVHRRVSDTYMSDVESVASEYDRDQRRLGRPNIPERDYPLPRAHSKRSKSANSIIRTPSGRYATASDYLKGYTPQEAPVLEEDQHVAERYYVKLKH